MPLVMRVIKPTFMRLYTTFIIVITLPQAPSQQLNITAIIKLIPITAIIKISNESLVLSPNIKGISLTYIYVNAEYVNSLQLAISTNVIESISWNELTTFQATSPNPK